jgi:YidC/Oxa1 family membrane protein insertase
VIHSALHANIFGATIADKFLFAPAGESVQAKIVICFAVIVSVVTTYLTVRQSTKRGMTPQMTPDNPMAASQKYMTYIVPFFALSGLYWAFGLVLYWMMTNIWTLAQQYVLFKRFPSLTAPVAGTAGGGTAGGGTAALSPQKPPAAGRKPAAGGPKQVTGGGAKPAAGGKTPAEGAKPATPKAKGEAAASANGAKPAVSGQSKRPAAPGKPPSPAAKRPPGGAPKPVAGRGGQPAAGRGGDGQQAGTNGTGLLRRFGIGKAEPEPQPETPDVKLVRQQRTRQSRSKRSGKR